MIGTYVRRKQREREIYRQRRKRERERAGREIGQKRGGVEEKKQLKGEKMDQSCRQKEE